MDEMRILASEASWVTLLIIYFVLFGAWEGITSRTRRVNAFQEQRVSAAIGHLAAFVFLMLPQCYILIVLVGRIFGQEWY